MSKNRIICHATEADASQVVLQACAAQAWIAKQAGTPLDLHRRMKFDDVGFHPPEDRLLNLIEQINQT